jgi:predicted metal-dependent peptidase
MTKATEIITKAKIQLILTQPFFATLALSLKYVENSQIKTARTNGIELQYNPQFIESLDINKAKGLLAHEVMHVAGLHHTRRNGRNPEKWNIACDYAINQLLKDSGFDLPDNGCIDSAFKNLAAEEIYSKLPDSKKGDDKNSQGQSQGKGQSQDSNSSDPGGNGAVNDAPAKTEAELKQIEAETKQLVSQAATVAKQQGKLPAHLERLIAEILEPVVNWKDVLNNFLTDVTRNDYTFAIPSKRYLSQGLYMPSLKSVERGKFVLLIDTSGSIDESLLNVFAGEMQSILSEVAESLTVIFVDAKVQHVQEFEADENLDLHPKGGGGTDFKPGFAHMEKYGIDCAAAIYFTDGFCNSFPTDPGFPVLWAIYNNKSFVPPFGETVKID